MVATGALFDPSNVVVGNAVLYVAPSFTPLPADSSVLFDPTGWMGKVLTLNGATSVTLSVTTTAGTQVTAAIANIATITTAALQTLISNLTNVGAGNVTVSGSVGGPFTVLFNSGLGAVTLAVSASTGGTGPTVTSGLWLPAGGSEAGYSFNAAKTTQDITIEEQSAPVGVTVTSQTVSITGSLAEDVVQSWQWALNATKIVTAQGVGQPGKTELNMSDSLVHYAAALEMSNKFGMARRIYIPDTVAVETVNVAFRRATAQRMVSLTFKSVCDIKLIKVQEITSPGL